MPDSGGRGRDRYARQISLVFSFQNVFPNDMLSFTRLNKKRGGLYARPFPDRCDNGHSA